MSNTKTKLQQHIDSGKQKVKHGYQKASKWTKDNKDLLIVLSPAILGIVAVTTKATAKHINLRKQEQVKNLYCYDRSLGHYWALRRELTNQEWVAIDARKRNGERLSDILSELKVLK